MNITIRIIFGPTFNLNQHDGPLDGHWDKHLDEQFEKHLEEHLDELDNYIGQSKTFMLHYFRILS